MRVLSVCALVPCVRIIIDANVRGTIPLHMHTKHSKHVRAYAALGNHRTPFMRKADTRRPSCWCKRLWMLRVCIARRVLDVTTFDYK